MKKSIYNNRLHNQFWERSLRVGLLCLTLILIAVNPLNAQNKNIENKKKQVSKLQEDIKFLDKQIEATKREKTTTLNQLNLIKKKVQNRKEIIEQLDADISEQDKQLESKSEELTAMELNLDTLEQKYKELIYKIYPYRNSKLWFMHIFSSKSVEQGYRRAGYIRDFAKKLNEQGEKIKEQQKVIEREKVEIAQLKEEKIKAQQEKNRELDKLKKEEKESQSHIKSLQNKQSKFAQDLKTKREQTQKLNREIERMIANAIAAEKKKSENANKKSSGNKNSGNKNSGSKSSATNKKAESYTPTPQAIKLSNEFSANKGKLPWPVKQGVVIEGFGENPHPTMKGVKLPFNNGINISAPKGCNILSVFNGVVKQIIYIPGYNNCILVSHGNYFTFYCKLGKVQVKSGESVKTGQVLGTLESSSETSELHFELWKGTQKQNPADWLK